MRIGLIHAFAVTLKSAIADPSNWLQQSCPPTFAVPCSGRRNFWPGPASPPGQLQGRMPIRDRPQDPDTTLVDSRSAFCNTAALCLPGSDTCPCFKGAQALNHPPGPSIWDQPYVAQRARVLGPSPGTCDTSLAAWPC